MNDKTIINSSSWHVLIQIVLLIQIRVKCIQ